MKREAALFRALTKIHALRVTRPAETSAMRIQRRHDGPGRPYTVLRCNRTGRRTVAVR